MIPLSNKPFLTFYGPVDTYSGYGARARDIAKSLIQLKEPEYDVRIISCNWGATPHGALDEQDIFLYNDQIKERILPGGQLPKQPDVWIMCTVPNEMQRVGSKYNICITAAVETHIATAEFVEGCNRADLVLTSSNFGKEVLLRSSYDKTNQQTGQKVDALRVTSKVDVLFEGLDTRTYHKQDGLHSYGFDEYTFDLDNVEEDFSFLLVGHWIGSELYHDRKNVATTIRIFLETFKNSRKAPALILKTSEGTVSIIDRERILNKIELIRKEIKATTLPNIYLVHGNFTDSQMNDLYAHYKVKAFVLLSNEGFGRPFLEFSVHQKPIICSNYSGHLDFLKEDFNVFVGGGLFQIHPSVIQERIIPPNGAWYYPNPGEASHALKEVYENYKNYLEGAKRQAYRSRTEFSLEKMQEKLKNILDENLPKVSQPISIKLPVLKPIAVPVKIVEDVEVI